MPQRPRGRLVARLAAASVLAGLLAAVVGAILVNVYARSSLRDEIVRRDLGVASGLAKRLDDRVGKESERLRAIATRPGLGSLGPESVQALREVARTLVDVEQITLYAGTGNAVASVAVHRLADPATLAPRPEFLDAVSKNDAFVSVMREPAPVIEVAVRVEQPPGTIVGSLVAVVPVERLVDGINEFEVPGGLTAYVVDAEGHILTHPNRRNVAQRGRLPDEALRAVDTGTTTIRRSEGRTLVSMDRMDKLPAIVVTEELESLALAPAARGSTILMLILIGVVMVTVAALTLAGRHYLRPLRPLAQAADRLGRGESSVRVPIDGRDEIADLAYEFNRMADALDLRIAELRQRRLEEERLREERRVAETLSDVGRALSAELESDQVVQAVTDTATNLTGAQFGAFFYNVVDAAGESYLLYTLSGAPREAFSRFPSPRKTAVFGPTFDGEAPVRFEDVTADPRYGQNPPYNGMPDGHLPVRSYLAVPVVSRAGDVIGGLFFGHHEPGKFEEVHERIAVAIAAQAAVALDNARLYEEKRTVAAQLQRALLPERLPDVAGLEATARYVAGGPGADVGGDWYDVIELPDGRVALVMGDVAGRGVPAAALMGQLRNALRAYALEGHGPAQILALLSKLIDDLGAGDFATLCLCVLDLGTGTVSVCSAGHPPPLLVAPGEAPRYLEIGRGVALCSVPGTGYREESVTLPAGSTLILYTDGLVESRALPIDAGLDRLLSAVGTDQTDLDALCTRLLAGSPSGEIAHDDAAILVARWAPLGRVLNLSVPGRASLLAPLRATMRRWLAENGASENEVFELLVAAGEACANAVIHGSGPTGTPVDVRAELEEGGIVVITVSDHGRWRKTSPRGPGMGLELMRTLVDTMNIDREADGTHVTLRRKLRQRAEAVS